jgi:Flp pilus assembly pilin Flp
MAKSDRLSALKCRAHAFGRDESGNIAIEYGLIAAMIFLAIVVSASNMGNSVNNLYQKIGNAVTTASAK